MRAATLDEFRSTWPGECCLSPRGWHFCWQQ
jgi:hypothetical protein